MKTKDLHWEQKNRGSIENWYGRIGDDVMFTACRFKDDKWILTSNIIPNFKMLHPENIETCKMLSQCMLDAFVESLIN